MPGHNSKAWRLRLTVQAVHAHHQVDAVVKLLVVLLRGEVGQVGGQQGQVAVQAALESQLPEQLLFGLVETGAGARGECEREMGLRERARERAQKESATRK